MAKFKISVHAVVFDDQQRILLAHHRDMDSWDLPGGGLDLGELPTEGAVRETNEETGMNVEVERLFIVGVTQEQSLGFVFYCRVTGGDLRASDKSDAVNFFALSVLPTSISPRKRAIIETAYQNPSEILYRHVTQPSGRQWYPEKLNKDR